MTPGIGALHSRVFWTVRCKVLYSMYSMLCLAQFLLQEFQLFFSFMQTESQSFLLMATAFFGASNLPASSISIAQCVNSGTLPLEASRDAGLVALYDTDSLLAL